MTGKDYQNQIAGMLSEIFGPEMVKKEWDAVKHDGHTGNHKTIYAPRHDIAVGPFNSYADLDIGNDKTWKMRKHPLTAELIEKCLRHREALDKVWNKQARCFLAIEIEYSGSSKHLMGSIINAAASGAIGIIITGDRTKEKVNRIYKYILRLEGLDCLKMNMLRNLIIFSDNEFWDFIKKYA